MGRKRIAELRAEHEHLLGLKIRDRSAYETGGIVDLAIEDHRPVITVDFPAAGMKKLLVVGNRRVKHKAYDAIYRVRGDYPGRYRWVDPDAALDAPSLPEPEPEREPTALFLVTIEAQTWRRAAAKRQQAMALTVMHGIEDWLGDALIWGQDERPDADLETAALRRADSEYFELAVTVNVFEEDASNVHVLYERLATALIEAGDVEPGQPEHWATTYLKAADTDLRQILTSRFRLEGRLGDESLPATEGRLRIR